MYDFCKAVVFLPLVPLRLRWPRQHHSYFNECGSSNLAAIARCMAPVIRLYIIFLLQRVLRTKKAVRACSFPYKIHLPILTAPRTM